jgi:sensor c-di-GMP phosphodiesterase-like protein
MPWAGAFMRYRFTPVAAKEIVPYYQPVVAFEGNRIIGFEALARWKNETLGWVAPELFITSCARD